MKRHPVLTFLLTILSFLILPPTLLILFIYQEFVRVILKIKYKEKFGGLVSGCDKIWTIEDKCRCIINILVIMESEETVGQFNHGIKNMINKLITNQINPKLDCTRAKYLGHAFLIKNQCTIEDLTKIVQINDTLDRTCLRNFLSQCSNEPLPKNNSALWQVILFNQSIKWSNNKNQHALIFRLHHSMGDGYAITKFCIEHLCDGGFRKEQFIVLPELQKTDKWFNNLDSLLAAPSALLNELVYRKIDRNILHDKTLSGEKVTVWTVEKEERLVPMTKVIKNRVSGTRFSDVIFTAISASLRDFFLKRGSPVPEYVTAALPVMFNKGQTISLENNLTILMLELPIRSNGDLLQTMRDVSQQTKKLRQSHNPKVNHWVLAFLTPLIPEFFLKYLKSQHSTVVISCLPGMKKLSIQQQSIRDVVFYVPHRDSTGVGIGVLTYDNKFQIGLNVDQTLLITRKTHKIWSMEFLNTWKNYTEWSC